MSREKEVVIAGIDPGTTVGYALIGTGGKLVDIGSSKQLDLGKVISLITRHGKPIIVGTDKKRVPDFVEKIAVKTGARVISPGMDLAVREKKDIAKGFRTGDIHQMDALASALFAFKKERALLKKIDVFVKNNSKEGVKHRLTEIVVKYGISIKNALSLLEGKDEKGAAVVRKAETAKEISRKDFFGLYGMMKDKERENSLLRQQNKRFAEQAGKLKGLYESAGRKADMLMSRKRSENIRRFRKERIRSMSQRIGLLEKDITRMGGECSSLYGMIREIGAGRVLLKKLANLGSEEFERKKPILKIREGDVLLVDDPNTFSRNVMDFLGRKVDAIVCRNRVSGKVEKEFGFVFIDAGKIDMKEHRHFAAADRDDLDRVKSASQILSRIVEDYRRERG